MGLIGSILRKATRKSNEPLNIIAFPTHERYFSNLARTNHNFYLLQLDHINTWNEHYAPIPENVILLPKGTWLPIDKSYDLILSQNKFSQIQYSLKIARQLHLPIVNIEHTAPPPNWSNKHIEGLKALKGDLNLFISEWSRKQWGWTSKEAGVIHHGIDTDIFCPAQYDRKPYILSVVNDWIQRDWCCNFQGWQRITHGLPVKPIGNTPGLSRAAKDINELIKEYQQARIFINTATISPIPTALLEAMACGCACVSLATCMVPEIIQHDYNGMISNDEQELRSYCKELLNNKEKCIRLGQNARKTIIEKFSLNKFIDNWDKIFYKTANIIYKGI
jgi:glycosyltransferase involved in cell wall biosynthesis